MFPKLLQKNNLPQFIDSLIKRGKTVFAPIKRNDKIVFSKVNSFKEIITDYVQTSLSPKEVIFPHYEVLFHYTKEQRDTFLEETPITLNDTIIFGLRPCDAAGFEYLKEFFLNPTNGGADYHIQKRLEKTYLITVSCKASDEFCFCTSVGLNPGDTKGSDILLTEIDNGNYYVEILTEKGNSLIDAKAHPLTPSLREGVKKVLSPANGGGEDLGGAVNSSLFADTEKKNKTPYLAKVSEKFNLEKVKTNIKNAYDSPLWVIETLGCLGCGACAFACPTCTCFDIQDEGNIECGFRIRCWDACGFGLFTQHASGHNPRHTQSERRRNRLMHKFRYSIENLGIVSCIGCGRCIRICPAQMNIVENIKNITET